MYCIDVTVAFAKQVLLLSKVLHKNKRNNDVMTVWFPKLLDTILSLLTDKIYTKDVLSRYIKVSYEILVSEKSKNFSY